MMKGLNLFVVAAVIAGGASTLPAMSANKISDHKRWATYEDQQAGSKICFALAQPDKSDYSQSISGRDPAYFMVTNMPAKQIREEASTIIGYPFQDASKVTVMIDGSTKFTMFTEKDGAWIENPAEESALINAMRAGSTMVVTGTSSRGTRTTDTYSLSGITAALAEIAKACP